MAEKTIFQKIIDREIPSNIHYEDEDTIVIHDINPQAPTHLLIIPKKPIARISEMDPQVDGALMGKLLIVAQKVTKGLGLSSGFRLVINNGLEAGETVPHLHIHILGGRRLTWPPG